MAKKVKDSIKEEYALRVEHLMNLVSKSSVYKQDDSVRAEGVILPAEKWLVRGFQDLDASYQFAESYPTEVTVESSFRNVFAVEAEDKEQSWLRLSPSDYRKFVKACKARKAELLNQRKKTK